MSKSILKKERYFAQVQAWEKKYGDPLKTIHDLSKTGKDLTAITALKYDRICAKKGCDRTYGLHRHHRGHDYIFACTLPDVYASRYIQYHNDDCCYLCKQHHEAVHRYYAPVIDRFFEDLAKLREIRAPDKAIELLCEQYKKRIVTMCDKFINTKTRTGVKKKC